MTISAAATLLAAFSEIVREKREPWSNVLVYWAMNDSTRRAATAESASETDVIPALDCLSFLSMILQSDEISYDSSQLSDELESRLGFSLTRECDFRVQHTRSRLILQLDRPGRSSCQRGSVEDRLRNAENTHLITSEFEETN